MKIIFIPTSKHREAKVRRFLGICLYDCFIYSSNFVFRKCLETTRHLGSGRKTVNSQGYSELREPIKMPKIAIHWFGRYYNIIYHKSNNENLTTPRQEPFLHNDINNHLSFGWVSKRNYNWRISTKLRVDIDRIHRTRHHPGTMRVKYPVSKLQRRKKELMLLCVRLCIVPCKTFDPVQSKPPTEQNERLLKVHECDWENILSFSQVILSVSSMLGIWSGCEYNLVSVYNLLSKIFRFLVFLSLPF